MQVREIMTPRAELIDANAMIRDAARMMRDQDLGALPVGSNGRLIGMVTDRDIMMRAVAADRGGGTTAVREVMSNWWVSSHWPIWDAAESRAQSSLPTLSSTSLSPLRIRRESDNARAGVALGGL